MRILITSGGTTEKIDQVRGITNFATGTLGKLLSEQFLAANHTVILLAGLTAVVPDPHPKLTIIRISDVTSLISSITKWIPLSDVCIHTMAVSDYTPVYMTDLDTVKQTPDLTDLLTKHNLEHKISSQQDYQVLFLKKTPKVIAMIKPLNPAIILIGFKLMVDVSTEQLIQTARQSLIANKADYILANDLTTISETQHLGLLVGQHDILEAQTKHDIATLIVSKSEETYDNYHDRRNR
ncbi:phosphopantothenate--cysteine ligase [Lactococcus piscium]|uniref:phosphopantothenate--cysteine ligase n=1 Tax=Pseudolactococcus carnosus TaxID=2749961 RepID=UPI001FBA7C41|nr:phosphopantothenate--cysteine ligase [Lactococcus carnosus]MCJ1996600.1 phosphopantothenate--cysteine ligase [Lactococcus carnosus]